MDIRKLKLDLTVALMNDYGGDILGMARDLMENHESQVGRFLDMRLVNQAALDQDHEQVLYSMEFERLSLDMQLISNMSTNDQTLNTFWFRQSAA